MQAKLNSRKDLPLVAKKLVEMDNLLLEIEDDGKGYPNGIRGNEIPILGRILTVCDSFDAMVSRRAYKEAMSIEYATGELERGKGTQFDPDVAQAFIELIRENPSFIAQ